MSYPNNTALARWLRRYGRTQADLARSLGVSRTAAQHWISGRRPIPATHLSAVRALMRDDQENTLAKGKPTLISLPDVSNNYWDWTYTP